MMAKVVWIFPFLAYLFVVVAPSKQDRITASVVFDKDGKTLVIKSGIQTPNVATGSFLNQIQQTGWSFFEVHTNQSESDEVQARGAGMVEGYLTSDLIYKSYMNQFALYCKDEQEYCERLLQFLHQNFKWIQEQVEKNPTEDYWHQLALVYEQYLGLQMGYRQNTSLPEISDLGFFLFQGSGSMDALEHVLKRKTLSKVFGSGSCSALVKLLPQNKELFTSHVTWDTYSSMLRIFKLYDLKFSTNGDTGSRMIPGYKQAFSSYPGTLNSGDDFYLISSGLVTQETTIGNYNAALWKYVTAEGKVLEWLRAILANRLAKNAAEWSYIFSLYNSGTYNNQWMVLDYNLFTPGKDLIPGTLLVLEQIPGIVEVADMTVHLQEKGYWASYNLPYFPQIFNMGGFPAYVKKYGSWFDYHQSPRGQIFKRDQSKVVDMDSFIKLMRYNDFKNDPLAKCNCTPPYSGENGISARSDLNPANGTYPFHALGHRMHGGTDCKATNSELFKKFSCRAVSGPTHDQQPVFQWSTSGRKKPLGHPDKFDFEPILVSWD